VTFIGLLEDKDQVLTDLQNLGCLHVIPLRSEDSCPTTVGPTSEALEALKFLLSYPHPRRQVTDPGRFDPLEVERQALAVQREILDLEDERDFLRKRIGDLEPWGDFPFPALEEMDGHRFWFYIVPHYEMEKVEETDYAWEAVNHDNRFYYIIVVSKDQPAEMPVERVRTGNKSLSQLKDRLEEVETRLDDLQDERGDLTRYIRLYVSNFDRLEDHEARQRVAYATYDTVPVFALQGWAPRKRMPDLES
jgi:V/A-type H+-transporting ATPase subunit I